MQAKVKARGTQPLVVTANRLRDGRVVWLGGGGIWSERVGDAAIFDGAGVAAGLSAAAQAEAEQIVVAPYEVEVTLKPGGPEPLRMRERVRVVGPSVLAPSVLAAGMLAEAAE